MGKVAKSLESDGQTGGTEVTDEASQSDRKLYSLSDRIKTLDELLTDREVDLTEWEVDRYTINQWEMGARLPDGKIAACPLWQVKATLKRRKRSDKAFLDALDKLAKRPPRFPKPKHRKVKNGCLLEIDTPDLHIGKLCWGDETGDDYDTKLAVAGHRAAVTALLDRRPSQFPVERVLMPIGNDLLNTDDGLATFAGTPQQDDSRMHKTTIEAVESLIWCIDECKRLAPVDIVVVPGNHDRNRAMQVGITLQYAYRTDKHVNVDCGPRERKYYRWGKVLLGFCHGDKVSRGRGKPTLPEIMADERPEDWAGSRWREWHLGHLHKNMQHVTTIDERRSCVVRYLSSLSGTDAWHMGEGYGGHREARAFLWHKDQGPVYEWPYFVEP